MVDALELLKSIEYDYKHLAGRHNQKTHGHGGSSVNHRPIVSSMNENYVAINDMIKRLPASHLDNLQIEVVNSDDIITYPYAAGATMTDMVDVGSATLVAAIIPAMTCTHWRFRASADAGATEYILTRGGAICDATLPVPARAVYEVLNDDSLAMARGIRWGRILFCDAAGAGVAEAAGGTIILVVKYMS